MSVRRQGGFALRALVRAVAAAALLVAPGAYGDGGNKGASLEQTLESVSRAERSVRSRMGFAEGLTSQLRMEAEALRTEIREEQQRQGTSGDGARPGGRIDYNLKLIQRLDGYAAQLEARRTDLSSLLPCFERYRERIRDEARLLRTLADADINELLREIDAMAREVEERCGLPLIMVRAEAAQRK